MSNDLNPPTPTTVVLRRTEFATFEATNARGGTILVGEGGEGTFRPVELLLTAMAACTGMDVDYITARRAEPIEFEITSRGTKHTEGGNRLEDLTVSFRVRFPDGEAGEAARERLPQAVRRSHDQLCTVSRTIELGTPVGTEIV